MQKIHVWIKYGPNLSLHWVKNYDSCQLLTPLYHDFNGLNKLNVHDRKRAPIQIRAPAKNNILSAPTKYMPLKGGAYSSFFYYKTGLQNEKNKRRIILYKSFFCKSSQTFYSFQSELILIFFYLRFTLNQMWFFRLLKRGTAEPERRNTGTYPEQPFIDIFFSEFFLQISMNSKTEYYFNLLR